jgi:hypothetical protein
MSDQALISAHTLSRKLFQKSQSALRRVAAVSLICCALAQSVPADPVTYQQLQQNNQGQGQSQQSQSQSGVAQESPNHPEFVRLPDGRIVRYGPGVLCDETCVEPVTPAAFREPGPRMWWIVPPMVAGGILCAFLCRGGGEAQPTPTILIPLPTPAQSPTAQPTVSPTPQPPNEIPEPGTLILFGLGIGAMIARRRMAAKKDRD